MEQSAVLLQAPPTATTLHPIVLALQAVVAIHLAKALSDNALRMSASRPKVSRRYTFESR